MMASTRYSIPRQSGVALGIVMWFLAGMSLLVSGIVSQARVDTRMAQLHLARATAVSAGDGAILLLLADVYGRNSGELTQQGPSSRTFRVGAHNVSVTLVPTTDLVGLNHSSAETLAQLLVVQGNIPEGEAKTLADNVLEWREGSGPRTAKRQSNQFQSVEDLLQVDGFTRTVWDGIRNAIAAVTIDNGGEGGLTSALRSARSGSTVPAGKGAAPGSKRTEHQKSNGMYRVDATVQYQGRTWLRRKWVNPGGIGDNGLPWKITHVEAPRVVQDN